jgi:hypothetical protein
MDKFIKKALSKSAVAFETYVIPHLSKLLGGGKIVIVEGVTADWMTRMFDAVSGIDVWYIDNDIGIRGIASRCSFGNKVWNTFTIRKSIDTGRKTEHEKKAYAIDNNWLYPYWTIQAYIDDENKRLLTFAVAKTEDILEMIMQDKCKVKDTKGRMGGIDYFYSVDWHEMRKEGYQVIIYDFT